MAHPQAGQRPQYAPDMVGSMAHHTQGGGGIPSTFRPQYDQRVAPYQDQPETAQTWDLAHADSGKMIGTMIQEAVEGAEGWWFTFAPLEVVTAGFENWESISTDHVAWDPAAESTAPRLVQIRREKHATRMMRFNLGLQVLHDNYLTERGQQEFLLKMNSIRTGLIITQKMCVASALLDAKLYWREQERVLGVYYALADATMAQKSRFGALSKDPLAINKIWAEMPRMLKGNVTKPNFNMLIVPEGTMAHYKYGAQARYHQDASLRGADAVQKNLVFSMQQFDGILPFPIYEDKTFQLTNQSAGEMDSMRRRSIIGQYAVLQHDDSGPPGFCGNGEPTIEMVTMPSDNWTPFTMRQCIENCARFGPDGTIDEFTDRFVEDWPAFSNARGTWPDNTDQGEMVDPWVVPYKKQTGGTTIRTAEFIGEQDIKYRGEMFDVEVGLCGKARLNLTEDEQKQLNTLLATADYLYRPSATDLTEAILTVDQQKTKTGNNVGDPFQPADEWGGYTLRNALTRTAWGWGDIFMVMSLLSQDGNGGTPAIPARYYADLDYAKCRAVLYKIWDGIKRIYPSLVTNDSTKVAEHRKIGDGILPYEETKDRNAMIATFRGLLERVKHPMWERGVTGAQLRTFTEAIQNYGGGGAQGSVFDMPAFKDKAGFDSVTGNAGNPMTPAQARDDFIAILNGTAADPGPAANLQDGFDKIKTDDITEANLGEALGEIYRTTNVAWNEEEVKYNAVGATLAQQTAARALQQRTVFGLVGIVNGVMQLARVAQRAGDWRQRPKLTGGAIDAMATQGVDYASRAYANEARVAAGDSIPSYQWRVTKLTLDPSAYGRSGTELFSVNIVRSPTDPSMPSRALFASLTTVAESDAAIPFARARYGEARGQAFQDVPQGMEFSHVHDQGEGRRGYGDQRVQYISASMAAEVGGPFLRLLPLQDGTYEVAEREYMSRRQAFIKHHLGQDPLARLMSFCFMLSAPTKQAMIALLDHNMPVPMNFVLAAPFINIDTEAIVFAEGGSQTAATGMNLLDINKTLDADHKIWNVHASVHTGAKIIQPEKILILEDAKFAGYISGLEPVFFKTHEDTVDFDITRMKHSMFCMDVSVKFTRDKAEQDASPINLFGGRPDEKFYAYNFKNPASVFQTTTPDFDSYFAYASYFNFARANEDHTMNDRTYRDLRESDWIPGTMWPTRTRTYNRQAGAFQQTHRGMGHLDDIDLPMREVLDGKIRYTDLHKNSHMS